MTNEIKNAYSTYIEISAKIKKLNTELEKAKKTIKDYHNATGKKIIIEDGFKSTLSPANRASLSQALLEKKFNIQIPKKNEEGWLECYSITAFEQIHVGLAAPENDQGVVLDKDPIF